jgi:YVTN family beta-propeller protein
VVTVITADANGKKNSTTTTGNEIQVGHSPIAIAVNPRTNTIYVANYDDNSVSVIDGKANKVVAKVQFRTEPFNGGHIECNNNEDKSIAPIAQQFYLYSGSECTAEPNQGFEFVSWQENLGGNSTQFLQFSSASNIWNSILSFLNITSDKPEAVLNIAKFGSFTANFKALPPPVPAEYIATLFAVVVSALVGSWLIPTVIEWIKTKKQQRKLDYYHKEIVNLSIDRKIDINDIEKLSKLRCTLTDVYARGKINKEQFDKLAEEIQLGYREIFTKEINSLNILPENDKVKRLSQIKTDVHDLYARAKINNE